jgi:hypothetical protein
MRANPGGRTTRSGKRRQELPRSARARATVGPWRALVIGLLAAKALSSHGIAGDSGVTVNVTSYRICVLHGCNRAEVDRLAPRQSRATTAGANR